MVSYVPKPRLNLVRLAIITQQPCDVPFMTSVSLVYSLEFKRCYLLTALIPPVFVDYVSSLKPLIVVEGYEWHKWRPTFCEYDSKLKRLVTKLDFDSVKRYDYEVKVWNRGLLAPDIYDLVLLQGRMKYAFARPLEIYREAKSKDPGLPDVSEQVLSYHFTRHVKSMWAYNSITLYSQHPTRVFYFEGYGAPALARILSLFPYSIESIVDVDKALVVTQLPSAYDEYVMKLGEHFSIDEHFYFIRANTVKVDLKLWKYVEGRRWIEGGHGLRQLARRVFNYLPLR